MKSECEKCEFPFIYEVDGQEYSKVIMVEVREVYDGGLYWMCPNCWHRWHRWSEGHHLRVKAERYVNADSVQGTP